MSTQITSLFALLVAFFAAFAENCEAYGIGNAAPASAEVYPMMVLCVLAVVALFLIR